MESPQWVREITMQGWGDEISDVFDRDRRVAVLGERRAN
jgi:hypothetical protein